MKVLKTLQLLNGTTLDIIADDGSLRSIAQVLRLAFKQTSPTGKPCIVVRESVPEELALALVYHEIEQYCKIYGTGLTRESVNDCYDALTMNKKEAADQWMIDYRSQLNHHLAA